MDMANKNKLIITEMDFYEESGVPRLEWRKNVDIRKDMGVEKDVIEEIENQRIQQVWLGHVNRLEDNR